MKKGTTDQPVQCSGESCPFKQCSDSNTNCGTDFTVLSEIWEIGRAVALLDSVVLKQGDKIIKVCFGFVFRRSPRFFRKTCCIHNEGCFIDFCVLYLD